VLNIAPAPRQSRNPRACRSPAPRRRPTCCPALCGSRAASASDSPRCAPCFALVEGTTPTPSDGRSRPAFGQRCACPSPRRSGLGDGTTTGLLSRRRRTRCLLDSSKHRPPPWTTTALRWPPPRPCSTCGEAATSPAVAALPLPDSPGQVIGVRRRDCSPPLAAVRVDLLRLRHWARGLCGWLRANHSHQPKPPAHIGFPAPGCVCGFAIRAFPARDRGW
jgi:hypothetical protein